MENLKVGFIGAGGFATFTLYPALHFSPLELQAICDIDQQKAERNAQKFGAGANVYTNHREMYEKEDLEAVIICMGPQHRQALMLEALAAGYHVFVPKPPASSLAGTLELAEAASLRNRKMMVNFQRRFSFGAQTAKGIMAKSSFGQVSQVFSSFCSGNYPTLESYLLDFAIHHFDLVRHLAGEVAHACIFYNEIGGQGSFAVGLQFESGAVGTMQLNSQRLWSRNYDQIQVTGQGEYIVLDDLWTLRHYTQAGNRFHENYSDQRNGELTGDGHSLTEFVAAIREDRDPVSSIHDVVGTMRLYDAVLQFRSGETITLDHAASLTSRN